MRVRFLSLFAGLAVFALSHLAAAPGGSERPPTLVKLDKARVQTVETWREVTGTLRPARHSQLAAEVPGRVVELLRREGAAVNAGEPVARLDDTRDTLELEAGQLFRDISLAIASAVFLSMLISACSRNSSPPVSSGPWW